MRSAVALLLILVAGLGACTPHPVGPARTFEKYEGKAVTTAESALSSVETVVLAIDTAGRDHAFGPYLSVVVSEQEEALAGVQGTFGSIQPPDERADDLRATLDALLDDALTHVADTRIALRRGELDGLSEPGRALRADANDLDHFIAEHGS